MSEKVLKKLITCIKNINYTVMWNDGSDRYLRLNNIVYEWDNGTFAYFEDFKQKHNIDLDNCDVRDFLCFKNIDFMKEEL